MTSAKGGCPAERILRKVLIDEAHRSAWSSRPDLAEKMNPVLPADASYAEAVSELRRAGFGVDVHSDGPLTEALLSDYDVVVVPHSSVDDWEATTGYGSPTYSSHEQEALQSWVSGGGGLVLFAETEQPKYGNSVARLAELFGVVVLNTTTQDPVHCLNDVATWVRGAATHEDSAWGVDLLEGQDGGVWYRAGALASVSADHDVVFPVRTHATAQPPDAGLLALARHGEGRVAVFADSDIVGDCGIAEANNRLLWRNVVCWVAAAPRRLAHAEDSHLPAGWAALAAAVEEFRLLQEEDGSVAPQHHEAARRLMRSIVGGIENLVPSFSHQKEHLAATCVDLERWEERGFPRPDFLDSLLTFSPDQARVDGNMNLVVFPMYTQNGNRSRNLEAVIFRLVWPDWIARVEQEEYANPAFLPIEFVAFTSGYDTHSAVLFPETVATRETAQFTWGGIFCDREAARWRRVTTEAAQRLGLALPPKVAMMLNDQRLAQETFILWDLVHDRTHSHGDLPFDPFMIKQRMPYWMYALEELRCDMATYREMTSSPLALAPLVRYAILFDRLFRFPTTGDRVRNYDGLGGQLLFAWLQREGVLHWRDNSLSLDWERLDDAVCRLDDAITDLYRSGINRPRNVHWLAAHDFVANLVPHHPASRWAAESRDLDFSAPPTALVDAVLPDEFPLNVFYEALRRDLEPIIASTAGITN